MRRFAVTWRRVVFHCCGFSLPRRSCGMARLVRSTFQHVGTDERLIRESLPYDGRCRVRESLRVRHFAIVESEALLVKVTEQMKRFHRYIRALDGPLQQRPEVLAAVRVNVAVNVLLGVVDDVVNVVRREALIREVIVRVDGRTSFDVLTDKRLKVMLLAALRNCGAELSHTVLAMPNRATRGRRSFRPSSGPA